MKNHPRPGNSFQSGISFLYFLGIMLFITGLSTYSYSQDLVFSEYFNEASIPDTWTESHSENITTNIWSASSTNYASGNAYELKASSDPGNGTSRMMLPAINTQTFTTITLNFHHYFEDIAPGAVFKIQTSPDGENWVDEPWALYSGYGNISSEAISVSLINFIGSNFYISFVAEGDLFSFNAWYIDDVELFATIIYPQCPALLNPSEGATNVSINTVIEWEYTFDASGYLLYVGTDNPPTNIINGTDVGWANTYTLSALVPGTQYYWMVIPYQSAITPSCNISSFNTLNSFELPFTESFESPDFPMGWAIESYSPFMGWTVSSTNYSGGESPELLSLTAGGVGITKLSTPPIDISGLSQVYLSFRYYFYDWSAGLICKIQTSNDMINWTDAGWEIASGNSVLGPELVNVTIDQLSGSNLYIAFVFEGDHDVYYYMTIDDVTVSAAAGSQKKISGFITYDNAANSPFPNCTVQLMSGQLAVSSATSSSEGYYEFNNVPPGSYTLNISYEQAWGGGSAVDALQILRHFVGMITLQDMRLEAANVDLIPAVNSMDALMVVRRFVGVIVSFPMADWVFENPTIVIDQSDVQVDISGICRGDVDGSFQP
ncbi:MAG: carboxypeptidase regulatory-like domain-containing protein [Bacteroidales bacterium]